MKREIKFRAWDGKQMSEPFDFEDIQYEGFPDMCLDDSGENIMPHIIFMQNTGLKDKNGKEIYEGDIVKIPECWDMYGFMAGEIREIYFKDGMYRYKPKDIKKGRGAYLEEGDCEIIGNIYENPELLEKK